MTKMELATAIARNASEALLLVSAAGALLAVVRWNRARSRDFLVAFICMMLGTSLAQVPVYVGGMLGWGWDLVLLSGAARWLQVAGAVLYIRAALSDLCGPWGWVIVTGSVLLIAWVM